MLVVAAFTVGALIGFGAGFLVFRNNQKRINNAEVAAVNLAKQVKDEAEKVVDKVKEL